MAYAGKGGMALPYIGIVAIKYQVYSAGFHKRERRLQRVLVIAGVYYGGWRL